MTSSPRFTYPFATSPDIIRSHQKDAYFSGVLHEQLSTIVRKLYGARAAHTSLSESRVVGEILYFGLTTLIGNRTLGEEYTDIVQVESESGQLPAFGRRVGYILGCIIGPYLLGRILPKFRRRVKSRLEADQRKYMKQMAKIQQDAKERGAGMPVTRPLIMRIHEYVLENIDTITSPSPFYALSLAAFYFSGSYYHLSKRIWGLRYIFTRHVQESDQRAGYEVLGVLLVLQMAVKSYLHLHGTLAGTSAGLTEGHSVAASTIVDGHAEISLDQNAYSHNNALLFGTATMHSTPTVSDLQKWTHTPAADNPRFELVNEGMMGWIENGNRKCTLCLEKMNDPSVTTCGHVFCWTCISDWAKENPHCPLCRQTCLAQHVLPLRC